jgi:hypothetical protein
VLDHQVHAQRNTIDNFGAQIIKATVKERKIRPLVLDNDTSNAAEKHLRVLVLTNQTISPFMVTVVGDAEIISGSTQILASGFSS